VLAAAGVAIGLSSLWSLPQLVLREGGGAFLLAYLLAVLVGALPILLAEMALGRRAGGALPRALQAGARSRLQACLWGIAGWVPVLAALLVLALFSLVAGWLLAYLPRALAGNLNGLTPQGAVSVFSALVTDPERGLAWHTLATLATVAVVARPLRRGLQPLVCLAVPTVLALLLVLVAHAASQPGFTEAVARLFLPDFTRLGVFGIWSAVKLAFFSLAAGLGAMTVLASHLPPAARIGRLAVGVLVLDLLASLLALLALVPPVLAAGLEPGTGTQLLFERVLAAFGALPEGRPLLTVLFLAAFLVSLTSMAGLAETLVASMMSMFGWHRRQAILVAAGLWWLLGLGALLSFNVWSAARLWGRSPYELLDAVSSQLLIPVAALLILVHAAWILARDADPRAVGLGRTGFRLWRLAARYLAPVLAGAVLLAGSGIFAELERLLLWALAGTW